MVNNKKAFTLIEVIGIVTILALILLLAVPAITKTLKRNEQNKYDDYIDNLKLATESYIVDQLKEGATIGEVYYLTLGDLIDQKLVQETIKNPENEETLSRNTQIKVTKNLDGTRDYKVIEHYLLPSDYTLVEYIESSGTQYIDTGIIPNQNTGFDIKFLTKNDINNSTYGNIIGARKSSTVDEFQISTFTNSASLKGIFRYGGHTVNGGIEKDTLMHITLKDKQYSNNNGFTHTLLSDFATPTTLTVFALNNNGTITQHGKLQLYSLEIYENDEVVREFAPCYRNSDKKAGLFDLVNLVFYTNKGTGEFAYVEK